MGRGRAKAKQAKVARQLKYHSPDMDLDRLQRELSSNSSSYADYGLDAEENASSVDDQYAEWADYFESVNSEDSEEEEN